MANEFDCSEETAIIKLGVLQNNVFPPDDLHTYIYKRINGHLYTYFNGNEKHICCDDGKINSVPIFTDTPTNTSPTHTPDNNHIFIYIKDGLLYGYDINKESVPIGVGSSEVGWNISEWETPSAPYMVPPSV